MENITFGEFFAVYKIVGKNLSQTELGKRFGKGQMTVSRMISSNDPIHSNWIPVVDQMLMEMDLDRLETIFRALEKRRVFLENEALKADEAKMRDVYLTALVKFLAISFKEKQYQLSPTQTDFSLTRFNFQSDDGESVVFQHIISTEPWSIYLNDSTADRFYIFTENVDVMKNLLTHYNNLTTAAKHYPRIKRSVILIDLESQSVIAENPISTN